MDGWRKIVSGKRYSEYDVFEAMMPIFDENDFETGKKRCAENKCGNFNTNWGCSVQTDVDPRSIYKEYDRLLIISRDFDFDWKDRPAV